MGQKRGYAQMEAEAQVQRPAPLPFQFTADGWEYFKIWIANLCLSILTLGIYTPWAKVRRLRYFWGNTRLGDASFDYLADPIAILKGRLLVVGFFAIYFASSVLWPDAEIVFGLLMLVLLPWAVVRSLVFRARNTAYRNIRFDYRGEYADAFAVYVMIPLLMAFTLGLIYPYLVYRRRNLLVAHSAYGTALFRLSARAGDYYGLFGRLLLLLVASTVGIAGLFAIAPALALFAGLLAYLFFFAYMSAEISNLTYNSVALGPHTFRSELRAGELFALYATNVLGILLTVGLFLPWARVRTARYRLERLALRLEGDLDSFVAAELEEVTSVGAEFGGQLDIDIGL